MVREIKGAEKEGTEWNFATEPVKKSRSRKVPEEIGFWASMQPEKKKSPSDKNSYIKFGSEI